MKSWGPDLRENTGSGPDPRENTSSGPGLMVEHWHEWFDPFYRLFSFDCQILERMTSPSQKICQCGEYITLY